MTTVSQLIVRYLERLGIDTVFGMPGAHILPIYDALRDSPIRTVLAKHEQGAAFMAGGHARSGGRIGACIATAGPGATNLITGVANAYADRLPMVVITGETSTHIFGRGGLQESSGEGGAINQLALFQPITRYARVVERTDYLPQILNQGIRIFRSTAPGPLLLSLPFNLQLETVDDRLATACSAAVDQPPSHWTVGRPGGLEQLYQLLVTSRRAVIIAGDGVLRSGAAPLVRELSQRLAIPVATTLKGRGVVDEQSPLSLGTLGVTSNGAAYRYLTGEADLVVIMGASFNERTSYLWDRALVDGRTVVQIDHDSEQLGKAVDLDLPIAADIAALLTALLEMVPHNPQTVATPIRTDLASAIFDRPLPLIEHLFSRLGELLALGGQVYDDNIIFAQNFLQLTGSGCYFPNSGISSLGHAIPAAIGASLATGKTTFAILGDGGFQMCCMELMTAVNYKIPLNVLLFNNGSMGLIRKNQHQHYNQRYIDCDFTNPDFSLLAESFGIDYRKLDSVEAIDQLFGESDLHSGIRLLELPVERDLYPRYSVER